MTGKLKKTRVFGCGNPFMGNDGAGVCAVEILNKTCQDIDAVDGGTGGLGLIADMEGFERIIIVDAMLGIGEKKGDIKIFYDTPPFIPSTMSMHDASISEVVEIAKEIIPGIEIITIGIEVDFIEEYSDEIDKEVMTGIHKACSEIIKITKS